VSFFRGYLHEDFAQEYGSASEARAAFLQDCERPEQLAFRAESARLAATLTALGLPEARRVLTQVLGSAWSPASLEEIKALLSPAPRA
jgi:hypothetical protein